MLLIFSFICCVLRLNKAILKRSIKVDFKEPTDKNFVVGFLSIISFLDSDLTIELFTSELCDRPKSELKVLFSVRILDFLFHYSNKSPNVVSCAVQTLSLMFIFSVKLWCKNSVYRFKKTKNSKPNTTFSILHLIWQIPVLNTYLQLYYVSQKQWSNTKIAALEKMHICIIL